MALSEQHIGSILIVDDDPVFVEVAAAVMSAVGLEVSRASDGFEALTILERRTFDTAIIDLDMPKIDGFRLIGIARSMPGARNMRILVITANRDPEDHRDALVAGALSVETKPVDWRALADKVRAGFSASAT